MKRCVLLSLMLTKNKVFGPFLVEVIRRLWDKGLYINNKYLQMIHDQYFDLWVDWRAEIVMKNVDKQIQLLTSDPVIPDPAFTETKKGETPLGGELRLKHDFVDD